jgi:hypothetical protein
MRSNRKYAVIDRGFGRWLCIGYDAWSIMPSCQYEIGHDRHGTWCSCPATGECKHIGMMRDRRRRVGLWYDPESDKWRKEELV